jgi:hypothetical protein
VTDKRSKTDLRLGSLNSFQAIMSITLKFLLPLCCHGR